MCLIGQEINRSKEDGWDVGAKSPCTQGWDTLPYHGHGRASLPDGTSGCAKDYSLVALKSQSFDFICLLIVLQSSFCHIDFYFVVCILCVLQDTF